MKVKQIMSRIHAAHSKYQGVIGESEAIISQHSDFDASIEYQPSDGFVLVDERANNAPLSSCIEVILNKGMLTHTDYLNETF